MSEWVKVGTTQELLPGVWHVIDVDGAQVAVVNVDGNYFAIEDVCTHDGGELTGGTLCGYEIECPRHGARFDVRTGAALCAPAYEATAVFPIRVEDGVVSVRDDRWD